MQVRMRRYEKWVPFRYHIITGDTMQTIICAVPGPSRIAICDQTVYVSDALSTGEIDRLRAVTDTLQETNPPDDLLTILRRALNPQAP